MIVSLGALLVLGTFLNIINIGQDLSKPFTGLRGIICRNFY
jgi:1-acyl-sn-glycerol-3-phosphate acyltransferase